VREVLGRGKQLEKAKPKPFYCIALFQEEEGGGEKEEGKGKERKETFITLVKLSTQYFNLYFFSSVKM
jgi:hypothetical protein